MAHKDLIIDKDPFFVIDPQTRVITPQSATKTNIIQFDHNSERFTFSLSRYVDGHDMADCNLVEVHYANIDSSTMEENTGVYTVKDLQVDDNDSTTVTMSWLLGKEVTQKVGRLDFLLKFMCVTDEEIEYAWNTAIFKGITIVKGMNNNGATEIESYDAIEILKAQIGDIETSLVGEKLSPKGSERFNDYDNNKTNIPYAHIEGKNNKAVIKCFLIDKVENIVVASDLNGNKTYKRRVTLKEVDGLEECLSELKERLDNEDTNPYHLLTCAIFYPDATEIYNRIRGSVTDVNIENRRITVRLGTDAELPTSQNGKWSTTGTFLNTFIVDGGSIGTHEIDDTDFGGFSLHMHGINNTGFMNAMLGSTDNVVKALRGIALGYKCIVEAERGFAVNYKNQILPTGFESVAFNMNNVMGAAAAMIGGRDNTTHEGADGSFNIGRHNNVYAAWAAALGHGLEVRNGSSLNAGHWNKHVDKLLFCLGNGSKEDEYDDEGNLVKQNRSNAMTVDWYGNIVNSGNINANGDIIAQGDMYISLDEKAATENYVDEAINEAITKVLSTEV